PAFAGGMFTPNQNPPQWNGLKFCLAGAKPVGQDTGLEEIRALAEEDKYPPNPSPGTVVHRSMLEPYVDHVLSLIDRPSIRPLTVAADTANGMGARASRR